MLDLNTLTILLLIALVTSVLQWGTERAFRNEKPWSAPPQIADLMRGLRFFVITTFAFMVMLPFSAREAVYASNDAKPAVGCYQQQITSLRDRPTAVFAIFEANGGYYIIGEAYAADGMLAARWQGHLVDLRPGDGLLHWVGVGHVFETDAHRTVVNFGVIDVRAAAGTDYISAGEFVDILSGEVARHAFSVRTSEECPQQLTV